MIFRGLTSSIAVVLLAVSFVGAQVHTPRITNDRLPDYTELGRFVQFSQWRHLPPQEKAVALWKFLTDKTTGLFPVQGIYEDPDPGPAFPFYDERDVVKVLNVHGHGYCGLLSPTLDGVLAAAGFSDSRIHNMDANHHCVTEVWYDDDWHYFDVDLRGMLYRPDGTVANIRDAMTNKELWTNPTREIEPFYPLDDKAAMFESFAACKLTPMYHWYKNGHTMDFALRPGERLTRWWQPQGGRWFHPWPNRGGFNYSFLIRKFNQEPRGLKSKHDTWSRWTHGNALFSYNPQLAESWGDFERGVYECSGLSQNANGMVSDPDGGYAVFEVHTPYLIAGRVHDLMHKEQIDAAATVYYRSLGNVSVSVSTDNGHSWRNIGGTDFGRTDFIDFSQQVLHTYGYLIRFEFTGESSGLAELSLNTWAQLAPVALTRLLEGNNRMSFALGDRYGFPTTVREVRLNLRDPAQLEHYLAALDGDYDPLRDQRKLTGVAVIEVAAKPGSTIKWFTAGGYFNTLTGKDARKTANEILYSTTGPQGPWKSVAKSKVPQWVAHWHYGMDEDVVLASAAEKIWLKYVGNPGVNQIWVYAHCLPNKGAAQNAELTHGYRIGGELLEKKFTFDGPGEYTVNCPEEPENVYLDLYNPSLRAEE
ncbi:MAG: hypothetical protein FVQ81_15195 [Candidatus Glassbacteria bacterium]|nr:hypothetical protein [Candidatus Glassbacteria bacterium]